MFMIKLRPNSGFRSLAGLLSRVSLTSLRSLPADRRSPPEGNTDIDYLLLNLVVRFGTKILLVS